MKNWWHFWNIVWIDTGSASSFICVYNYRGRCFFSPLWRSLTCIARHYPHAGSMNVVLGVQVDFTNTSVECTFEPGYTCTIDYGTDPSYTNLVYRDASTTLGQVSIITLSQDFQRSTTYYFIVSANSSSQCERVHGIFRTGGWINSSYSWHRNSIQEKGRGILRWLGLGACFNSVTV